MRQTEKSENCKNHSCLDWAQMGGKLFLCGENSDIQLVLVIALDEKPDENPNVICHSLQFLKL